MGWTIVFRPEARYEHAFDATAYDTGTKQSRFPMPETIEMFEFMDAT